MYSKSVVSLPNQHRAPVVALCCLAETSYWLSSCSVACRTRQLFLCSVFICVDMFSLCLTEETITTVATEKIYRQMLETKHKHIHTKHDIWHFFAECCGGKQQRKEKPEVKGNDVSPRSAEWKRLNVVFKSLQSYSWVWRMECCFELPEVGGLAWVCSGQSYSFLTPECTGHDHRPQKLWMFYTHSM